MNIIAEMKRLGLAKLIDGATINGRPVTEYKEAMKRSDGWPGYKSKWESLFALELDAQKATGEIIGWLYEPLTFRLTDANIADGKKVRTIRFTPDFVCWLPSGRLRCIEVKGFRNTSAINRFKLAKDKFRHEEWIMVKHEHGGWVRLSY
jgi:hypothetical protein